MTIAEMINIEKNSDDPVRRMLAAILNEAFDMDWICEDADAIGFEDCIQEIENTVLLKALADRF